MRILVRLVTGIRLRLSDLEWASVGGVDFGEAFEVGEIGTMPIALGICDPEILLFVIRNLIMKWKKRS